MADHLEQEMREVAEQIERIARASKCWSKVHEIVYNCSNHIRAVARIVEVNAGRGG
jgi:hypothetical protein